MSGFQWHDTEVEDVHNLGYMMMSFVNAANGMVNRSMQKLVVASMLMFVRVVVVMLTLSQSLMEVLMKPHLLWKPNTAFSWEETNISQRWNAILTPFDMQTPPRDVVQVF
jgi:hypothetical protein